MEPTLDHEQREVLAQALDDAVSYRDPPLYCPTCLTEDRLCDDCTATLARARSYTALGRTLGVPDLR